MISDDIVAKLNAAVNNIVQVLNADRATFFLIDELSNELWSVVGKGLEHKRICLKIGEGIAGKVAETGQLENIQDAYLDSRFDQSTDKETGYSTKTILCVPILNSKSKALGVVQVINKKTGFFTTEDEILLKNLSIILALTIENTKLLANIASSKNKIAVLLDVANAMSAELDLDTLLRLIVNRAADVVNADRATIFLLDKDNHELYAKSAKGLTELRFPASQGIAGHVATTGENVNIPDAYSDERFNKEIDKKTGYFTKNLLCVPIINTMGDIIGVIQVVNKKEHSFDEQDEELLNAFSAQAGIALENAKLYDGVLHMRDHLDSILQSLSNGVITLDKNNKITTANAAFCSIFGYSRQRLEGKPYHLVFQRNAMPIIETAKKVQEDRQARIEYEAECRTLVGEDRLVNIHGVPLMDKQNNLSGTLLVIEDLTKEKRIRTNLVRYMAKDVLDHVLESDDLSALAGKRMPATILFSDIRSFTSLTESSSAEEIVEMLNDYFTHMVDAIFKWHGVLDKFIGDAIMAVFGPPNPAETDPYHAVMAALEMKKSLVNFNIKRKALGKPEIKIGIGISTGEVVAGSIGSEKRMDYTSIGDGVNLASRLEGVTKMFGTELIISEFTYEYVKETIVARELDSIKVKGKNQPVRIFEVKEDMSQDYINLHNKALSFYKEKKWAESLEIWKQMIVKNPRDKTAEIYIERCQEFVESPPGEDWDGVFVMKTK